MDGLTRVDYPDGNYVSYGYDNACRLTKVTTPFGSTSYEYDLLDRMTRVVDRNGYATVYEYDANGNRIAVHYANGFTTTYEYDLLNRLICEKTVDNRDNVVVQYIYTLGAAGERKSVTELDRTVEYSYDSLYRLTSETITEDEKVTGYTYAYDNVSNRILKTENGAATEYVYNALNQLVSDSDSGTTYEYDLNGNLIRVIGSAQSALYEYNSENKLVKATVQNGVLVTEESYTYDYQGNRTSKTTHRSDGVTEYVKYLNDNSSLTNVLAEMGSEGLVQAYYTIGADLISQERDGNVSVYLYDGHGSVVGLANENGKVTDTYAYDAFGNLLKSKGSTKNCYRYCGEQFDETTGLYYLRARYMDTSTGRFISQDTYQGTINDPVSLHKYLYANSNPVTYSDPSGYVVAQTIYLQEESQEAQRCLSIFKSLVNQIKGAAVEVCKKSIVQQVAFAFGTIAGVGIVQAIVDVTILNILISTCIYGTKIANAVMAYASIKSMIQSAAQDIERYGNYNNNTGTAIHHIVQKNNSLAEPARKILKDSMVNICENYNTAQLNAAEPYEPNLIKIKTLTHRAIHSQLCNTVYTLWVNSILESIPHINGVKLVNFIPTVASLTFIAGVIISVDRTITPSI